MVTNENTWNRMWNCVSFNNLDQCNWNLLKLLVYILLLFIFYSCMYNFSIRMQNVTTKLNVLLYIKKIKCYFIFYQCEYDYSVKFMLIQPCNNYYYRSF